MIAPKTLFIITAAVVIWGGVPTADGQDKSVIPDPSADLEVRKWKSEKERYEAEKATCDAKLAALKAQIGELQNSGYTGGVAVGAKAGQMEAALLAAKAVNVAAIAIAARIPDSSSSDNPKPKFLLYTAGRPLDSQAYLMFKTQLSVVNALLEKATEANAVVVDGKRQGQWVARGSRGRVLEGPYADGKRQGQWVERSEIRIVEGPFVDGKKQGQWVVRYWSGAVMNECYLDGKRHGERMCIA